MTIFNSLIGIVFLFFISYIISNNRKCIRWTYVIVGLIIQVLFAIVILKCRFVAFILTELELQFDIIYVYVNEGMKFLLGSAYNETTILAVKIIASYIFIFLLVSVLYYFGVIQFMLKKVGSFLSFIFGDSIIESINAFSNIFCGQVESMILINPYMGKLSNSELFTIIVSSITAVPSIFLVKYAMEGMPMEILTAISFMSAPISLVVSKVIYPQHNIINKTNEQKFINEINKEDNLIQTIWNGINEGGILALKVLAMVVGFMSLISIINGAMSIIGVCFGIGDLRIQKVIGYILAPMLSLIGVKWSEAVKSGLYLSENFVNLSVVPIVFGGIMGIAKERVSIIGKMLIKALVAAIICNLINFAIVNIVINFNI